MSDQQTILKNEFLSDHQQMTRLLVQLHRALVDGDRLLAKKLAVELDQHVGPHIQFEETVLYPLVAKSLGTEFSKQLYSEHSDIKRAVRYLVTTDQPTQISIDTLEELKNDLDTGVKHAESCGTLLSYLTNLPEKETTSALKQLRDLRKANRRWVSSA